MTAHIVTAQAFQTPGRIAAGTVLTPDLAASLADYTGVLGLEVIDDSPISPQEAASWAAPAMAGRPARLLRAPHATPYVTRLIAATPVPGYRPLKTFGWAAYEHSVVDCDALFAKMPGSGFTVIGEPKLVPGFDNFIPFQVTGRAGETLYLNQVLNGSMSDLDLPNTRASVDQMFIAVLAARDREATLAFHTKMLGFEQGETWVIPYSVINNSFGLPPETTTAMTMTKTGRIPASEVDQYPEAATPRPTAPGELPPGNAIVSFLTKSLDAVAAPLLGPVLHRDGPLYAGRRSAAVRGPSGEIIELIEAA
ncbi:MAG: VOC family protein [Polymorphobacter sp.]|uniref:VOC family protein n=1 Tax=Polymorphobacter sp. TaxID=1909290 RepID=UPI003A8682FC